MTKPARNSFFNSIKTLLSIVLISLAVGVIQTGHAIGQNSRGIPPRTIAMWNEAVPVPLGWCALDGSDPSCGPDHGHKLLNGQLAYYPEHGVKHCPTTLFRHLPVAAHNHDQSLSPHFKLLFIKKT